ncbi:hypothetical protein [Mucilaginibacter psychrotolerans]|uniref:Glycoside hydrolase family 5 domain-containing protein n=1 Tax=Mucilaginibacter psychrotolerans TaxID=1524096 RepID=A0A4Y8SIP5_9SPHI|nr:hypothetical protein [Mucilaginibacter psychrotolerans]TFF38798.1 hypothetical protein E2R66_07265 [Mucilaginibacter psychrotolerans]
MCIKNYALFFTACLVLLISSQAFMISAKHQVPVINSHLLIDNNQVIQNDFLGVNAVYHGFTYMPDNIMAPLSATEKNREFARVRAMELKIARTWYRPNWACATNLFSDFDWNSMRMQAFYQWLDKMKKLNVKVALQAGWFFPQDTYFGHITPDSTKNVERYAEWVSESLNQMINVRGYSNIKYLMLFTKPLNSHSQKGPEGGFSEPNFYAKVCTEINEKLIKTNLRSAVKLVGPNSGSTDTAAYVGWSVNKLNNVIDIFSWHTYNGQKYNTNPPSEYDGWKQIVDAGKRKVIKTNKPYWIDEYGANQPNENVRRTADYGNYIAQAVAAFTNSGAQTSLLWILFDQKYEGHTTNHDSFYKGIQRWGLTQSPQDSLSGPPKVYPAWYSFAIMSKYLGNYAPTKVYKTTSADSLYVVSTSAGSDLTVMVVNAAHSAKRFDVKFARPVYRPVYRTFNRHVYDPEKIRQYIGIDIIPSDKKFAAIATVFSDQIPARGVSIYTTKK